MKKNLAIFIFAIFALSGCDFIKGIFNKSPNQQAEQAAPTQQSAAEMTEQQKAQLEKAESTPKDAIWAPSKDIKTCGDGSAAKVIGGDCSGQWTIRTNSDPAACLFTWGPAVSCPEGTVSMTRGIACDGYIARAIVPEDKIVTPADCEAKHGKTPVSPVYEIQCCPAPK